MSQSFMHNDELRTHMLNKGELIAALYPSDLYQVDAAVPQSFIDELNQRGADMHPAVGNPASHFCTVYPRQEAVQQGHAMSQHEYVAPLTAIGVEILARFGGIALMQYAK